MYFRPGVASLDGRLKRACMTFSTLRTQQLHNLEGRLRVLDPKQVLARGYAWLADENSRPVTSVRRIAVGVRLTAVLTDGSVMVAVDQVMPDELAVGEGKLPS